MYESVVYEHMPKTATARKEATNWKKRGKLGKKNSIFSRKWVGRETETEYFFGAALRKFLVYSSRVVLCTVTN